MSPRTCADCTTGESQTGTDPQIKRVAVIGGGITGLAAAYRLRELAAAREFPLDVNLLERGARCGGALETIRRDGFVIETGADSFISEKRACAELAARLGLGAELIPTREIYRKTCVVRAGRLVQWAGVAADCGYFDQAHFIRDFHAFSGLNPSAYLAKHTEHLNHVPIID